MVCWFRFAGDDLWAMVIEEVSLRHHTLINMECLQSLFDMVGEKIIPEMDVKSCQETSIWTSDVHLSRYIHFSHPGRNTYCKLICDLFPHYWRWTPFQVLKTLANTVPLPPGPPFRHQCVGFKLLHWTPVDLYLDPNLLCIYFLQFIWSHWAVNVLWEHFSWIHITFCDEFYHTPLEIQCVEDL